MEVFNYLRDEHGAPKKTSNIKIRNTSLVTSAKAKKAGPAVSHETSHKHAHASHPDSHNHLTNEDIEHKKATVESKKEINTSHKVEPKVEQHKSENNLQQPNAQEKSPEKASPQKSAITEEISASPDKKDNVSTSVRPIDRYEDEMEEYLKLYLNEIDESMKNSFLSEPKTLLERANMGQDPMWFELVESSNVEKKVGLAVAHIDNTVFTSRRLVILHFTSADRERYQEFLGKFVEYLWKSDECNEIKISLYYLEDQNSNLGADKQLQECIKKLGFRWKQLTNDKYTGKRYIDYIIKRPEGVTSEVINA